MSLLAGESGLFYISNKGYVGNCLRWWCTDGHGYTCDLNKAWLVTKEKADELCRSRPLEDIPYPQSVVDSIAERHVSCETLRLLDQDPALCPLCGERKHRGLCLSAPDDPRGDLVYPEFDAFGVGKTVQQVTRRTR